jgi:hypothetical protein
VTERHGGCGCGKVRFVARGEPKRVGLCHCLDCRKLHAAPFMAFAVFEHDAVTVTGAMSCFESQPGYRRRFCAACGSQVIGALDGSTEVELKHGSFDEPGLWAPSYELWTIRREPWLGEMPGLIHRHAGNRPHR